MAEEEYIPKIAHLIILLYQNKIDPGLSREIVEGAFGADDTKKAAIFADDTLSAAEH